MNDGIRQPTATTPSVAAHSPCRRCGYDLHGLPENGNCPECGRLVERSLHVDPLRNSDPRWLLQVAWGARLLLIAAALLALGVVFLAATNFRMSGGSATLSAAVILAGAGGALRLLKPEPGIAKVAGGKARRFARVVVLIAAVNFLIDVASVFFDWDPTLERLWQVNVIAQFLWIAGLVSHLHYLEKLLPRMQNRTSAGFVHGLKFWLGAPWAFVSVLVLFATFFDRIWEAVSSFPIFPGLIVLAAAFSTLFFTVGVMGYIGFLVFLERAFSRAANAAPLNRRNVIAPDSGSVVDLGERV